MKILLGKEEVIGMIHSALCNGGLSDLAMCGLQLSMSEEEYKEAKASLLSAKGDDSTICREDVYIQPLKDGKALKFYDFEGDEDLSFTLDKALEELGKEDALEIVLAYKDEQDDATTGAELIQFCLYGEVIFG